MTLKLTIHINGMLVIDPTRAEDLELLKLLSTKELFLNMSTYDVEKGYVGTHLEPGSLELGKLTEDLLVLPRGTHDAQWKAYDEERDRKKAAEVAVSNAA